MASFKPVSMVVCEDIRTETNRKLILIGVFASDILVQQVPIQIALQAWAQIKFADQRRFDLNVRWIAGEQLLAEGKFVVEIEKKNSIQAIAFPKVPMTLTQECDIRIQAKEDRDRRWTTLVSIPVAINPDLPTSSVPPSEQSSSAAQP